VTEQEKAYTEVFAAFPHHKVVLRTLDAGADKPLAFLDQGEEPNRRSGCAGSGSRSSGPTSWTGKLSAVAAAAERTSAEVWVMAPMIALASEASWFADRVRSTACAPPG